MAANQLVQTRIDGAIKEEAAAVLAAMGLTVSDAVRLLLTKVAQDKALPFEPLIPNATTIEAMKEAGRLTAQAHDLVRSIIVPGMSTLDIDEAVIDFLRKNGAESAFKGYRGFPGHICASINETLPA